MKLAPDSRKSLKRFLQNVSLVDYSRQCSGVLISAVDEMGKRLDDMEVAVNAGSDAGRSGHDIE